jgi:opacity protein-like surface antigen
LFNFGPSVVSSNGNIQYGIQSKFGFENIRVRTAMHFGSGSAINGAFTYSLSGQPTMFNPFIGGGIGYKSIKQPGKIDADAFAFYGTGGVDLNLTENLSISGAVNLPTDSAYGTEFQAAINFFGSF